MTSGLDIQALKKRLKEIDDVNDSLRAQVRENHEVIEQLMKEPQETSMPPQETPFPAMQFHLYEESERELGQVSSQREKLEADVATLEKRVKLLNGRNEKLRSQSRRIASLVASDNPAETQENQAEADASIDLSSDDFDRFTERSRQQKDDEKELACVVAAEMGDALWNSTKDEGDTIRSLFDALLKGVEKICECGRSASMCATMLYVVDEWLRDTLANQLKMGKHNEGRNRMKKTVSEKGVNLTNVIDALVFSRKVTNRAKAWRQEAAAQRDASLKRGSTRKSLAGGEKVGPFGPTIYYLAGKIILHGYRTNHRVLPAPPAFSELGALPRRSPSSICLPLQHGAGQPVLAVLQVASVSKSGTAPEEEMKKSTLHLSEAQLTSLQLLCSMATGILHMQCRIGRAWSLRGRARDALNLTSEVNGASNMTQFEQRAKRLAAEFFTASSVRLIWYDPPRRELITTDTRPRRDGEVGRGESPAVGRRNISRFSVQEGVVGQCVRQRKVVRILPNDGRAAELVGPMMAKLSNGSSQVVGVVQVIGTRKAEGFTDEDELFFAELMNIIGLAARRTMRAQAATERYSEGDKLPSLERLMLII